MYLMYKVDPPPTRRPRSSASRSLAVLAEERDRALRALSAEEDKRYGIVEELSGLLGDELSCVDVSRLTMGLERVERERWAADEGLREADKGEIYGSAWVLEVSWSAFFS